ncbi:Mitochondrial matrix cochaperone [Ptychographa xylographoides]|nr:Mitochondrial matrix cochaperone [Ptychographa xylographoides]
MIQRSLFRQSRAIGSKLSHTPSLQSARLYSPPTRIAPLPTSRAFASRWYSSGSDTTNPPTTNPATSPADSSETSASEAETVPEPEDPVKRELEAKNKEVIDLKDKYLRSVADFRNLQERTKRDVSAARDFAITKFAKDLIDSVDNLDRALETVPAEKISADENKDLKDLYDGLRMTERILMQTLSKHGLQRFDPSEKAERFDPNVHEATFMTKVEGKEDGSVFTTVQKGFQLNGRVIRAAKVGVVKNT